MEPDYRLAFELAPVGLCLSRNRVIVDCNAHLCEMFGWSRETLTGMYMSLPWSNWRGLFRFLWGFEGQLARLRFLRPAYDAVSWRLMVVADKPAA